MPRILDAWTDIAVYIYKSLEDAQQGVRSGGSGFIVSVPFEVNKEWSHLYTVTNRHVVRGAVDPVIRINRKDGTTECIQTNGNQWEPHSDGDDVAIYPFKAVWEKVQINPVPISAFITRKIIFDEDVGIGDDTIMIGRFMSHDGTQQNSPSVRFGNIAMMSKEKIVCSETGIAQESFLVEIRSLPGYSGSAVILYSLNAMNDMSMRRQGKERLPDDGKLFSDDREATMAFLNPKGPYLLGIDWCHLHSKACLRDRTGEVLEDR
jgi:hypothetical protein